jgi:hypothetical protein
MIPRIARALACGALLVVGVATPAAAQLTDNLGALTGENAKGYLGPLPKALSGTLNSAIFQTGHVPKTGIGFTIGVRAMGVSFSDESRLYTPTDPPGFSSTAPVQAPTVVGDLGAVAQDGQGGTVLYHPGGFDIDNFPLAVPQLEIGSFAGTRAVVRWIAVDVGDSDLGKISLFGIGGQHSLSQYLPPGFPVDIAAGIFYQKFSIDDDMVEAKALHFNVTGSRRFTFLEPYVGVGIDKLDMSVSYESDTGAPDERIDVDFDSETNAHLTAGIRASLAFVKLHAEGNIAAENGVAVGLSFGR